MSINLPTVTSLMHAAELKILIDRRRKQYKFQQINSQVEVSDTPTLQNRREKTSMSKNLAFRLVDFS